MRTDRQLIEALAAYERVMQTPGTTGGHKAAIRAALIAADANACKPISAADRNGPILAWFGFWIQLQPATATINGTKQEVWADERGAVWLPTVFRALPPPPETPDART